MKKLMIIFVLLTVMLVILTGCESGTGVEINIPEQNTTSGTPNPEGQIEVPGFTIDFNTAGVNPLTNQVGANNRVAGLLIGVWHGIISPVTLVISFMNPNVRMYEVHNTGSEYDFGFMIGVAIIFFILGILLGRRRV